MHRYFVTGTDTDVGKTRVAAALALALRLAGHRATLVKLAQTGLGPEEEGDAQRAGRLAEVPHRELARFAKAADAWSAALAEGKQPPAARDLALTLGAIPGPLVVEGSGGVLTPLRPGESVGDAAAAGHLQAVLTVGMRLGCLNHALLTLAACRDLELPVAGALLVERWGPTPSDYRDDLRRVLQESVRIFGVLPFGADEAESVRAGAKLFEPLVNQEPHR